MQIQIIFFNILFILSLLIAVFFLVFWGKNQSTELIQRIWPLGFAVLVPLGIANTFFVLNRKLLALLEKEDWPALTAYLEKKIYGEGMYKPRHVKLLAQSYLATEDFDGAINLKNRLVVAKPALVEDNALILGIAYLLGGNAAAAVDFFGERLEKGRPEDMNWLRWYYGFSLILTKSYEQAGTVMEKLAADMLAKGARDMLVTGLTAFVLTELTGKSLTASAGWRIRAEEGKSAVRKNLKTAKRWIRKAEKLKTEMHGAVIRNYVDKTGAWIWGNN